MTKEEPKTRAIICDIDGTLAIRGERSPYDYSKVSEDEPNLPIVELAKTLSENWSREIIFVSGRDDSCEFETNERIRVTLDLFDSYDRNKPASPRIHPWGQGQSRHSHTQDKR